MAEVAAPTSVEPTAGLNVTDRLTHFAATMPDAIAVACPFRKSPRYRREKRGSSSATYATTTFAELDADASAIARGLLAWGVPPGARLALLVRPGIEFITLVFGLLRAGMVIVLVDPGLGRRNLLRCLQEAEPEGFVAIPVAQAARVWWRSAFPRARWNVTVGSRLFWGGLTLDRMREFGKRQPPATRYQSFASDPAAFIFTSGSTGPPKGVLYTHRMFDTQVTDIQSMYDLEPGGIDLACFPLFALFNAAMGVTTVLPEMDFSRPASADPKNLLAAANDWKVTQAFASPAVWRVVSDHCAKTEEQIPTLRQVFSCGAPVPAEVLQRTLACVASGAEMHTPYGATECLPVATIEASEVFGETAELTGQGAGVCVGRRFDSVEWRVIRITDAPITQIEDSEELPTGEIGELIVRGPQASPRYMTSTEHNAHSKIVDAGDAARPWHRMGDVGYFDHVGRFWYCGRKSQRVDTAEGTLFTECVEAVANTHPDVRRSALVGVERHDKTVPVLIIERSGSRGSDNPDRDIMRMKSTHANMSAISRVLEYHGSLPVDVRHNSKINREQLAIWAQKQLARHIPQHPAPSP
jgi:acyl-CoA synthetase (AMP-forming)/AMP-acid ligase II